MKQFSIRDLGWLTLLVAVLLMWWIDHRRNYRPYYFTTTSTGDLLLHDDVKRETLAVEGVSWPEAKSK